MIPARAGSRSSPVAGSVPARTERAHPGATLAPTWNFSAAHSYGVPQILDPEENLAVLARLVAHFECRVEEPMSVGPRLGRPVARGTVGLRLPITRFVCNSR
ncbi:MAG: FMN-binding negative transcriptional regulator [Acidimicrobiales bacterium]